MKNHDELVKALKEVSNRFNGLLEDTHNRLIAIINSLEQAGEPEPIKVELHGIYEMSDGSVAMCVIHDCSGMEELPFFLMSLGGGFLEWSSVWVDGLGRRPALKEPHAIRRIGTLAAVRSDHAPKVSRGTAAYSLTDDGLKALARVNP